jgi:energy-coupling factor transporter transmembrane protein EcfT
MRGEQIHRISSRIVIALSLIALLAVLSGYLQPPHTQNGREDEGAAAHIFQISIVLVAGMILVFLATGDWKRPWQSARPLALPAAFLVLAFGALYYLEQYYLAR